MKPAKRKKCTVCRTEFKPYRTTQRVCGIKCARIHAERSENKKTAIDTRKRKERLKTRSDWLKGAQKVVNEYVRLYRDSARKCISCDQPASNQANYWDAGHYRSRGASPELRFNTLNIHKQCKRCNRELSGNVVNMRIGLIQRYGEDYVNRIERHHEPLKADVQYLQRLIKVFRAKIRLYKKIRQNCCN